MEKSTTIIASIAAALTIIVLIGCITYGTVQSDIRNKELISKCIESNRNVTLDRYGSFASCN